MPVDGSEPRQPRRISINDCDQLAIIGDIAQQRFNMAFSIVIPKKSRPLGRLLPWFVHCRVVIVQAIACCSYADFWLAVLSIPEESSSPLALFGRGRLRHSSVPTDSPLPFVPFLRTEHASWLWPGEYVVTWEGHQIRQLRYHWEPSNRLLGIPTAPHRQECRCRK